MGRLQEIWGQGARTNPSQLLPDGILCSADLLWPMSCSKENEMGERSVHIDSPYIVSSVSAAM